MLEAYLTAAFIYQAIAFFLLGSWKESIHHEEEEIKLGQFLTALFAAIFWPFVVLWYLFTRKK